MGQLWLLVTAKGLLGRVFTELGLILFHYVFTRESNRTTVTLKLSCM